MSLTRKIAHNTAYQIIGKIISTFLGLIGLGMMTRYLGDERFGWYITVVTFLQFVGILIDFGLIPVTAQMLGEAKLNQEKLLKNLLTYRLVTALIFLGLAPFVALFFPYPNEVKIAIGFTTISFLSIAINQVLVGFYQYKLKMYIQAIGEIIGRIVLVTGLWLVMAGKSGFIPVMIVVTISSVAYTLVLLLLAHKETHIGLSFDWGIWKMISIKMWPIAVSIIFNVVYLKGDILLLTLFSDQITVGLYGAAYRVIDILAQTAMMLMGVLLPLLAFSWTNNQQDFKKQYQMSFDSMMLLAVPMAIGTALLSQQIMTLVAGDAFSASGIPLQILAIAVFGVYLGGVFGHVAVAINKQKQTLWIYISNAVLTLIGYLIFIPRYGMLGAAWMTVFSELYAGFFLFLTIRHYIKIKLHIKTFLKIIFASIIMATVLYLLRDLHVLLLIVIGIVVYGLLLLATKTISKQTIQEILSPQIK